MTSSASLSMGHFLTVGFMVRAVSPLWLAPYDDPFLSLGTSVCLPFCWTPVPIWGSICAPLGLPWPTCGCEQRFPTSLSLSFPCSGQCFSHSRWVSHITNPSTLHSVPAAPCMTWRKGTPLSFSLGMGGNQQHPDDTPGQFSIHLCLSSRLVFDSILDPNGCILSLTLS